MLVILSMRRTLSKQKALKISLTHLLLYMDLVKHYQCTSKMKPVLCLFPENIQQDIKTPLFITMSAFDIYQVLTTVEPNLHGFIENGTLTASQKKALREFRPEFLSTLPKSNNPKLRGVFIDSVNHHTSLLIRWSPENATMINNLSLSKAFADWYFDRKYWYVIDEHDLSIPKSHEHDKQAPKSKRRNGKPKRRIIFMKEVNVHICNV